MRIVIADPCLRTAVAALMVSRKDLWDKGMVSRGHWDLRETPVLKVMRVLPCVYQVVLSALPPGTEVGRVLEAPSGFLTPVPASSLPLSATWSPSATCLASVFSSGITGCGLDGWVRGGLIR